MPSCPKSQQNSEKKEKYKTRKFVNTSNFQTCRLTDRTKDSGNNLQAVTVRLKPAFAMMF